MFSMTNKDAADSRSTTALRGELLTDRPGNPESVQDRLDRIRWVAKLMDSAIEIPVIKQKIGLDSVVGLIPGVGDMATVIVSSYIVREAWQLGVPKHKIAQMVGNITLDSLIGIVPLLGDLFDMAFKANLKNVELLERHLEKQAARRKPG